MSKGQRLLDFLTSNNLFGAICSTCDARDGFVFVWSSGAAEQLDAFMTEQNRKRGIIKCRCGHNEADHWTQWDDPVYRHCEIEGCNCEHFAEQDSPQHPTKDSE